MDSTPSSKRPTGMTAFTIVWADHRRRNAIARSLVLTGFRSVNHLAFAVQRKATDLLIVDLGSSGWRQSYGVPTPVTSR